VSPALPLDAEHGRAMSRVFWVSCLGLYTAGLSFALRGAIAQPIEAEVLALIDPVASGQLTGQVLGAAFAGFATTLLLASIFLARIGIGRAVALSGVCFASGTLLAITANPENANAYRTLWLGFLLSGFGWGFAEASINPLVAALYPDDKTHRLNRVHAWWPAGVLTGGVFGGALGGLGWRVQFALVALPAIVVACVALASRFPRLEREELGVSWGDMFREIPRRPMFLVWFACMFLTAAAELAPGQWIDFTLTRSVGMRGIWLLVYVSLMMFVFRHFAGPLLQRLGSPAALLWISVTLAASGLVLLPRADSPLLGLAAATVWGLGVCFLWPTMLATVSERYPRGGELFIGLMGFAGAMSIQFVLPMLGRVFDAEKLRLAGGQAAFARLEEPGLHDVLRGAAEVSFRTNAILPAILIAVFGVIWFWDWRHAD
jgi:fucose permease